MKNILITYRMDLIELNILKKIIEKDYQISNHLIKIKKYLALNRKLKFFLQIKELLKKSIGI